MDSRSTVSVVPDRRDATVSIEFKQLDEGGLLGIASDTLTGAELLEANSVVYETDEKTRAIVYIICDYRRVKKVEISAEEIRELAERDKRAARINPKIVMATVVSTDLGFGLSRMWQAYTGENPFVARIFRAMDEAERWVADQVKALR